MTATGYKPRNGQCALCGAAMPVIYYVDTDVRCGACGKPMPGVTAADVPEARRVKRPRRRRQAVVLEVPK